MTGIDGYDWSVFGGNPVPGDPDVVRRVGQQFADASESVRGQQVLLRAAVGEALQGWSGPASSAFASVAGRLEPELDKLVTSYADAGRAVAAYWPKLRSAQELAVRALHKAQHAQTSIGMAKVSLAAMESSATQASNAYDNAVTATVPHGDAASAAATTASLKTSYQEASSLVSVARQALAGAHAEMAAAVEMKDHAAREAARAASGLASEMRSASDAGIDPGRPWIPGLASMLTDIPGLLAGALSYPGERYGAAREELKALVTAMLDARRQLADGVTPEQEAELDGILRDDDELLPDAMGKLRSAASLRNELGGLVGKASKPFTTDLADVAKRLGVSESSLEGVLGDIGDHTPVVSVVLTGLLSANDIKDKNYLDLAGDGGGLAASTATGIALASNPVGWAIAGSLAAGLATTWGIEHPKTVSHALFSNPNPGLPQPGITPGQIVHFAGGVVHGVEDAPGAVAGAVSWAWNEL